MKDLIADVRWLHISDFHFKSSASYDRDVVLNAFLNSLPNLLARAGQPSFIIASGDIAHSGLKEEYDQATAFFNRLLGIVGLARTHLIVIPGNHDVDRKKGRGLARTLHSRKEADDYFDPAEPLLHVSQRQQAFLKWYNEFFSGIRSFPENTTCAPIETIQCGPSRVCVLPVNSAAFCFDDNDNGKLWIGRRCLVSPLEQLSATSAALKLVVMHHPFNWLSAEEEMNVKGAIRSAADCVLTGHLHATDVEQVVGVVGGTIQLTAGALYQTRDWPNTAMFCALSGNSLSILPIRYEDSPSEIWTLDPSRFPQSADFIGRLNLTRQPDPAANGQPASLGAAVPSIHVAQGEITRVPARPHMGRLNELKKEFEQDLFVAPSGKHLYAEPRLRSTPQELWDQEDSKVEDVSIDEIVASEASYIIESRSEYGGSNLCKRLCYEFARVGAKKAIGKDARDLPNYRRKLETSFDDSVTSGVDQAVLVLDHFDLEKDERLLKELLATKWFCRIIAVTVNRGIQATRLIDPTSLAYDFQYLYLWGVSRNGIREMAEILFDSQEGNFISRVVDKVYSDLLGLCIPLTPSNIIMYLKILHREGEFHPLNRVDIVGRYVLELLRRPSDVYSDTFNSKNKADVLSEFVYSLYQKSLTDFDERYWHEFVKQYQERTLFEFDGSQFFRELIEARILVRWGSRVFFKYSFFFTYFLGRHIASRSELLSKFLDEQEYLKVSGVVDVITGLSSDNSRIIISLTKRLRDLLTDFSEKYIREDFDPLAHAVWPDNDAEEDKLWRPIEAEIASGPRSAKEIDLLKTSLLSEAKTADQEVHFAKFLELESSLFFTAVLLQDALRNGDDVTGEVKLAALDVILRSHHVALQVGSIFAGVLAQKRYFKWGGVAFLDFNRAVESREVNTPEAMLAVIDALINSVSGAAAEEIASHKLAPVFRARERAAGEIGSLEFINFECILKAKGPHWAETLIKMIERTDKNSYFLSSMLRSVMANLRNDIVQSKDRDALKRLVALIHAKRSFNKQAPGSKAVTRMLDHLTKNSHFDNKS